MAVFAACFFSPVLYLWWTNFCFSKLRYVTKEELCEAAFATLPAEIKSGDDRCEVETSNIGAYDTALYLSKKNMSHNFAMDNARYFDGCGRRLKFH